MDRAFVGSLRRISTRPEGNPENGTSDQQTIGVFSTRDADVPVVLVRVTDPNSGKIWLFSAETLSKVPELYDNVEAHQVENKLPQSLVRNVFLGMPLWQWLALFAAIPVAIAIGWAVVLLLAIPRRLWLKFRNRPNLHSYSRMSKPLLVSFSALAHRVIAAYLGLPLLPRLYYYRTIGVLISIGFFWFLLRVTSLTMQRLRMHAISAGRIGTGTLMVLAERLLTALVVIVAVLAMLGILGFNLTTVLAGLGIGGIAIAFAAQKTLENLFGGISVLADEVIRVGDYCRFGDRTGTVEDISLRSTRVRTDARTELSIPNGALATMSIENFTRRDKILFNPALAIRYETTARPTALSAGGNPPHVIRAPESRKRQRAASASPISTTAPCALRSSATCLPATPTNSPPSAKTSCCALWISSRNRAAVSPSRRKPCILLARFRPRPGESRRRRATSPAMAGPTPVALP